LRGFFLSDPFTKKQPSSITDKKIAPKALFN